MEGYINIDSDKNCHPDLLLDLENSKYPFEENSIDEIYLDHVLEHLGETTSKYFNIWKEFYRICKNGATITIVVPHPRHDNFLHDPTHVRIVTPEGLHLFDQEFNRNDIGGKSSKLGVRLGIDFHIVDYKYIQCPYYAKGNPEENSRYFNNVAHETRIVLKCRK
jgi:hypothetical protein